MALTEGFNQFDVDVHFDPTAEPKITFSGNEVLGGKIAVPQGMAVVSFHLVNASSAQPPGLFPSDPIQWVKTDRSPAPQPQALLVQRISDLNVVVQVTNTVVVLGEFPFFMLVQQDRLFYAHDPTIINLPPTGGGQKKLLKPKPKH
jgi:hypothetical protein